MIKPTPGTEPPRLTGAASRLELSPLARLTELEVLADEHHHHRLSYCHCRGCIEEVSLLREREHNDETNK
jgi:hypothetical protein